MKRTWAGHTHIDSRCVCVCVVSLQNTCSVVAAAAAGWCAGCAASAGDATAAVADAAPFDEPVVVAPLPGAFDFDDIAMCSGGGVSGIEG